MHSARGGDKCVTVHSSVVCRTNDPSTKAHRQPCRHARDTPAISDDPRGAEDNHDVGVARQQSVQQRGLLKKSVVGSVPQVRTNAAFYIDVSRVKAGVEINVQDVSASDSGRRDSRAEPYWLRQHIFLNCKSLGMHNVSNRIDALRSVL
ncbi:hypothetical protein BURKHO8Y_340009 [Burkholderia sp. 8Y]|nr:hypothetical protein BURKHO8Y_340009 [Burkholderia sp. 8Y]